MSVTGFVSAFKRWFGTMAFACGQELCTAVRDEAIVIFIIIVPLGYPLLYSYIYNNEVVRDVPVAVVDESRTSLSRKFVRLADATENIRVTKRTADMETARELMRRHEIYGILYIPGDFSININTGRTAYVSILCDASSLLYYKAVNLAATNASLDMNAKIKVQRAASYTMREDEITAFPLRYEEINIFNPAVGIASFLIPAVLILILQQTMLLGIGINAGTMKERRRFHVYSPFAPNRGGICAIVLGRAFFYVAIYSIMSLYVLGIVPRIFHLNHIGHFADIVVFMLPYLLAVAFFAMTFSYVIRSREACMLLVVYMSLVFIFIAGVSWPGSAIPAFWRYVSYIIPSTPGINGFVRLNNEGARLFQVAFEYRMLWVQTAFYFIAACLVIRHDIKHYSNSL